MNFKDKLDKIRKILGEGEHFQREKKFFFLRLF